MKIKPESAHGGLAAQTFAPGSQSRTMRIVDLTAPFSAVLGIVPEAPDAVISVGNFDGVHKGHQAILAETRRLADAKGLAAAALTFEPHPRQVLNPATVPFRLTDADEKAQLIAAAGIDRLYRVQFDQAFAQLSAESFVADGLVSALKARHVVTGHDFTYGAARTGTVARLAQQLNALGVGFTPLAHLAGAQDIAYSSSRARACLKAGEILETAHILGRYPGIAGTIIHGDKRGRQIGFPTANFLLYERQRPRYGVYAIWCRIGAEIQWREGVANIGRRPTMDGVRELAEVHIFGFDGDIYGQTLAVRLAHFLRPEQKFGGMSELTAQIGKDVLAAQNMLPMLDPDQHF